MTRGQIENFERAFSSGGAGCVRTCRCGKVFYDHENSYDWEEGEFEKLEADKDATGLPYSVGTIILEGCEYVMDCTCWQGRATKVVLFLEAHLPAIKDYFDREKVRLTKLAENATTLG